MIEARDTTPQSVNQQISLNKNFAMTRGEIDAIADRLVDSNKDVARDLIASNLVIAAELLQSNSDVASRLVSYQQGAEIVKTRRFTKQSRWHVISLSINILTLIIMVLFTIAFFKFAIIVRI